MISYTDLQIRISEAQEESCYHLQITREGHSVSDRIQLPYPIAGLQETADKISREIRRRRGALPNGQAYHELEQFGQSLFRALFTQPNILPFYKETVRESGEKRGVRHRLITPPSLWYIPWEYLHDDMGFLSMSVYTPIVRFIEAHQVVRPLHTKPPLRLLILIASPSDVPALDTEREKRNISSALENEPERVLLTFLEHASYDRLREVLLQARTQDMPFHIVHFVGHGGFDTSGRIGYLLFEKEDGSQDCVTSKKLWYLLNDHRSIRLAVINACETANTDSRLPFAGIATRLVQAGIPAVLAMQSPISDNAAIRFAGALYHSLVLGDPIDSAVGEGRKCLLGIPDSVEFGAPVLFMSTSDGTIFSLPTSEFGQSNAGGQSHDIRDVLKKLSSAKSSPPIGELGQNTGGGQSRDEREALGKLLDDSKPGLLFSESGQNIGSRQSHDVSEALKNLPSAKFPPPKNNLLIQLPNVSQSERSVSPPLSIGPTLTPNRDPLTRMSLERPGTPDYRISNYPWDQLSPKEHLPGTSESTEPEPSETSSFADMAGCAVLVALVPMLLLGGRGAMIGYENYGIIGAVCGLILGAALALAVSFAVVCLIWKFWRVFAGAFGGALFGVLLMFFLGEPESWSTFVLVGAVVGGILGAVWSMTAPDR